MADTSNRRHSFKRWHPLLGEWVIFAPTTAVRPWSGSTIGSKTASQPEYDPNCYLCPGVTRAGGKQNPTYTATYVFDNDFPSLSMASEAPGDGSPLLPVEPARGICRVVCFSPKHNVTLAEMSISEIDGVLHIFRDQFIELSNTPGVKYVLMFENKGTVIGVSNPHPHGQIYASDFIPRIPLQQMETMSRHLKETGTCLYCTVIEDEMERGTGIVTHNEHFLAFVPSFARHAFETHIVPFRHVSNINELTPNELRSLASIYRDILIRYDNLFQMPFPNITLFRNAPCDKALDRTFYHFHIEFCPPLRSHDKLKYMAGFETGGGNIINPSLPEESAATLRSLPTVHYSQRGGGLD